MPGQIRGYADRGRLYELKGERDKAIADYRKALSLKNQTTYDSSSDVSTIDASRCASVRRRRATDYPISTQAMGLSARAVSGAFVGWIIATMHDGSGIFGAIAGIAGAVIGAYAGHAARLAAIARIGRYPAAIVEDLVAIGLAALIVTR